MKTTRRNMRLSCICSFFNYVNYVAVLYYFLNNLHTQAIILKINGFMKIKDVKIKLIQNDFMLSFFIIYTNNYGN